MAIKRRLTNKARAKAALPDGWERAVRHPICQKLWFDDRTHYHDPQVVAKALMQVRSGKGASWNDKIFVIALDILLEKAFGHGVLDSDAYNRLWEHLDSNSDKMQSTGVFPFQTWIWDLYHDHYKLNDMEAGNLTLPVIDPSRRVIKKKKSKRRVLKRS